MESPEYQEALDKLHEAEEAVRRAAGLPDLPRVVVPVDTTVVVAGKTVVHIDKLVLGVDLRGSAPHLTLHAWDTSVLEGP